MSDSGLPQLSEEQCARYRDDGFLFLPNLISERDIARARDELAALCRLTRDEVIFENDGRTVRSVMNPQAFSDLFGRFVRLPALLGAVRQLLGARRLSIPVRAQHETPLRWRGLAMASGFPDLFSR